MGYISVADAAREWGVSERRVQVYCRMGRIEGADRFGRSWRIPADAHKPADPRVAEAGKPVVPEGEARSDHDAADQFSRQENEFTAQYLPSVFIIDLRHLPNDGIDARIETLSVDEHAQYQAELNHLRGNFEAVESYCQTVDAAQPTFLCACSLRLATAVERGDYVNYSDTIKVLEAIAQKAKQPQDRLLAEMACVLAAVSMYDGGHLPAWLQEGDLSLFPHEALPWALYIRVKYLEMQKRYDSMLATARTALLFCSQPGMISTVELYLRLSCAAAYNGLGDDRACASWLGDALARALPHGLVTPFADTALSYGGMLEPLVQSRWPRYRESIIGNPNISWKSWIAFHNQFAKDNITLVLSDQEYTLALHLAKGKTYSEAAKTMHLSVGRVKNLVSSIYAKLNITNRKELIPFIL